MPLDVIMPALGMAQETGQIVAWHKQPGDAVAKGDVLFEVETDKATMEVEAQGDGFLTDVTADQGTDVPVGNVIARISESPENTAAAPSTAPDADTSAAPAASDDLPEGKQIIMPTLGMAQDTGLLVAWHRAAGDAVGADDVLFEVETDKSTVEVNAGADGYIAAILASEGEDVPVGQTIAIISAEAPANPVTRSAASALAPAAVPDKSAAQAPAPKAAMSSKQALAKQTTGNAAPALTAQGRILASPKARRLARERGLDLSRLVDAGYAPPFHVKDLDTLAALPPEAAPASGTAKTASRITATIATEGFTAFAAWASEKAKLTDSAALLAGLSAASMGRDTIVAVDAFGDTKTYAAAAQLSATEASDDVPQLRLRDLRFTAISTVEVGGEDVPTLTLCRAGDGLSITLEYADAQLDANAAITLLSNFAGRMEQPLRHLF